MKPEVRRISHESPADEAPLLQAAQAGDGRAFAELVRRYQRAIYAVAYGFMRSPADADDVAQETFVRAYRALGRFRVGEPLYPWLARIATNAALSQLRSRRRKPETPLEPLLEAGRQWSAGDDPAERAAEAERARHLKEAMAELTPEHQAVLVLRVVEDLSYDEIARTLGVPAGTVMSRLSRARAELRAKLAARRGDRT